MGLLLRQPPLANSKKSFEGLVCLSSQLECSASPSGLVPAATAAPESAIRIPRTAKRWSRIGSPGVVGACRSSVDFSPDLSRKVLAASRSAAGGVLPYAQFRYCRWRPRGVLRETVV